MEPLKFSDEQKKIYRTQCIPSNATDEQVAYFFLECERRGLIPGTHVVMQTRKTEEYQPALHQKVWLTKAALVTTINALRLIAERSKQFRGYGRTIFYYQRGDDFLEKNIPIGATPHAVTVELYREGWQYPELGIARYAACVQLTKDKTPTSMWFKRAEEQLAKCAEADGLRRIAPEECGGLYIEEEMGGGLNSENESASAVAVLPPAPTVAPTVNQSAAVIKTADVTVTSTPAPDGGKTIVVELPSSAEQNTAAPPAPSKPESVPPSKPPVPRPGFRPVPKPVSTPPAAPATTNVHGLDVSDNDLPDFDGKAQAAAVLAPPVAPVPRQPLPVQEVKESVSELNEFADRVARDTAPAKPPLENGDRAVTEEEYAEFTSKRGAKISRDILESKGKLKGAGPLLKDYLLKKAGVKKLKDISKNTFERLLSELEKATPEDAVKLVTGS